MTASGPDRYDRWFARLVVIVALGLLIYEGVGVDHDRPYFLGTLLVILGFAAPLAVVLDALLRRRNGGNGDEP